MDKDKLHREALDRFKRAVDAESKNRNEALDDIKFARLGDQWPAEMRQKREREQRPCLTANKLPAFIRQITNEARLNKPSISVHPIDDGSDPDTAEILNGLIRNIEVSSNADVAYIKALDDAVTGGFGYFRVRLDYADNDVFEKDLLIERIANPFSVYRDPNSVEVDSSDWNWAFVTEWIDKDQYKAQYPDAEDCADWETTTGDGEWVDDEQVRIAEYWKREEYDRPIVMLSDGTIMDRERYDANAELFIASGISITRERVSKGYRVTQYLLTGREILDEIEWPGQYIPIVPVFGEEVVVDGERHLRSLIRDAKDSQVMYNYWRTAGTEALGQQTKAPWIGPVGFADTDAEKWATANTEAHPYLEYDGNVPPQRQPFPGVPMGFMQEALTASDEMKAIIGIYDASLGARSNETSGKAILARQREGDVSTYHFLDNLAKAIRHLGRILIDVIPRVYDQPRILRVLGEDEAPDVVPINQEVPGKFRDNGEPLMYDLTIGKYDVTVKQGPSFTTKREEAATQMTEMVRAFPQSAPYIGDLLAKNLDWPGADEIAKRLKALLPAHLQDEDEIPPQAKMQIQQLTQTLEMGKATLAETQQKIAELEMEKRSNANELQVRMMETEKRFQADMAKIQAQLQIAENKETEANRRLVLEEAIDALKYQMEQQAQQQATAVPQMIEQAMAALNAPKVLNVMAPSGKTYEGRVENGQIEIVAPSGDVYSGTIH